MEFRHMRRFLAVAEELHFARAAERLHIEQSPLSRAIKELESDLGVQLFERTTRSTRLTWAGQVFLEDVRRVFAALDQARINVKAAANGYHGTLRIAVSDGIVPSRRVWRRSWPNAGRRSRKWKPVCSRRRSRSRSRDCAATFTM